MLASSHIVAGGVVGSHIGDPFLAFLVGIIIHFILDAIPHFDTIGEGGTSLAEMTLIILDFLMGLALIIWVLKPDITISSPFIWGAVGGMTPDLFDNVPFWKEWFRKNRIGSKIHNIHEKYHSRTFDDHPVLGLLTQYVLIGIFGWLYILKK